MDVGYHKEDRNEKNIRLGLVPHCGTGPFRTAAAGGLRMPFSVLFGIWGLVYRILLSVIPDRHRARAFEEYYLDFVKHLYI